MKNFHVQIGLLTALLFLSSSHPVFAHGGVDYDKDVCLLTVGPYKMNFTGYLPETAKSEEFCDDIPGTGLAIIVLDYIDKPLRNMKVDFRILDDINNIGNTATIEDLGNQKEIEAETIYYIEPKIYQIGTLMYQKNFDKPGHFIGILTARREDDGEIFTSVFPFSVGYGIPIYYYYIGIGLILLLPLLGYIIYTLGNNNPRNVENSRAS